MTDHTKNAANIQRQTMDIAASVPHVMTQRITQMMTPGYNPMMGKDQVELNQMVSEKAAAFCESWWAMGLASLQAQQKFASDVTKMLPSLMPTLLTPAKTFSMGQLQKLGKNIVTAQYDMMNKGLEPVSSRVKANAVRLKK